MRAGRVSGQVESLALYGAPGAGSDQLSPELAELSEGIPGIPGEDYPVFSSPPDTDFSCEPYIEGRKNVVLAVT